MAFRSAYSKKTRKGFACSGESKTKQSFKDQCDVNKILKKYRRTGLVDHVNQFEGYYGDLSHPVDYQTALNVVINANNAFESLPAEIRKKFMNNPQEFLDFVSDESNKDSMVEMGLIAAEAVPGNDGAADVPGTADADPAGGTTEPTGGTE